jgi:hypothetical protein
MEYGIARRGFLYDEVLGLPEEASLPTLAGRKFPPIGAVPIAAYPKRILK